MAGCKLPVKVRFSIGPLNTEQHIEKAIAGVKDIAQAGLVKASKNKIVYEPFVGA